MRLLDREGSINSRRGVGTVVAQGRLREQHQEMRSFSEEIRARGGRPDSRLIALDLAIEFLETVKINVDLQQLRMEVPLEASGSIEQKSFAVCAEWEELR